MSDILVTINFEQLYNKLIIIGKFLGMDLDYVYDSISKIEKYIKILDYEQLTIVISSLGEYYIKLILNNIFNSNSFVSCNEKYPLKRCIDYINKYVEQNDFYKERLIDIFNGFYYIVYRFRNKLVHPTTNKSFRESSIVLVLITFIELIQNIYNCVFDDKKKYTYDNSDNIVIFIKIPQSNKRGQQIFAYILINNILKNNFKIKRSDISKMMKEQGYSESYVTKLINKFRRKGFIKYDRRRKIVYVHKAKIEELLKLIFE